MTLKEFQTRFKLGVEEALIYAKRMAPVKSGNLRNAIRIVILPNGYSIIVDTKKASYMNFTEEKWSSNFAGGRKNPNEAWFRMAVPGMIRIIARKINGSVTKIK